MSGRNIALLSFAAQNSPPVPGTSPRISSPVHNDTDNLSSNFGKRSSVIYRVLRQISDSAWADANLAEVPYQLRSVAEHSVKVSSTNSRRADGALWMVFILDIHAVCFIRATVKLDTSWPDLATNLATNLFVKKD